MVKPGSVLKYDRAYKHLVDAKTAVGEFLAAKPYDISRDGESQPGKLSFWITLLEDPPPEISLAAGDAIHNMRSALDHIVYELSSKREANPRDTAFPLLTKEKDWDRRRKDGTLQVRSGKHRIRLLPSEAQTFIHNVQPWPRPEPFWPDLFGPNRERLRELHALDIADKHRNLNLAILYVDMVAVGTSTASDDLRFEYVHKGPLQPNTRTLLARFVDPAKVYMELLPQLDVVFDEGLTPDEPVGRKLDELFLNVSRVLSRLWQFA